MTTRDKYKRYSYAAGILLAISTILAFSLLKFDPMMHYMKVELPILFALMVACVVLSNREGTYRARLHNSGPEEEHF